MVSGAAVGADYERIGCQRGKPSDYGPGIAEDLWGK